MPITIDQALAKAKKAARQNRIDEALELYGNILRQQPKHPLAKKAFRKLSKSHPQTSRSTDPTPQQLQFLVDLCRSGQMSRAEQLSVDLLKQHPRSVIVLNILGVALQRQGKLVESLKALDDCITLKPGFAEAHCNRAITLRESGREADALDGYTVAIKLKPDYAEALYNRANLHKDRGNFEAAIADYQTAITHNPNFAEAYRNLSALASFTEDDIHVLQMQKLLENQTLPETDRAELGFALAATFDKLGSVDKCFSYLKTANQLRKQALSYNIQNDRDLFKVIRRPVPPKIGLQPAATTPIFIVGMMRSGTSLVEQILASHSEVFGAGELEILNALIPPLLDDIDADDSHIIESIRRNYLEALGQLDVKSAYITDKMPSNFRWVSLIQAALPEAKIVHVSRDPVATCWSIYKNYFPDPGSGYAYDLNDLATYYQLYHDLMAFWATEYPGLIFELSYDQLTVDQETQTRRLLDACGLPFEQNCLSFHKTDRLVKTLSAAQIRKPLYQGSSDNWHQYAPYLQNLVADMAKFGRQNRR